MAISGANPKNKTQTEAEKIESLAAHLLMDTKKHRTPSAVGEYGYLEASSPLSMRDTITTAQKELKTIKTELPGADLDAIELAYKELHKAQGEYWDNVLRGKHEVLATFKTEQDKCAQKCKDELDKLKPAPPGNQKVTAALDKQIKALNDLPNNLDKDRTELVKNLTHAKERNFAKKSEQAINASGNVEEQLFSVFRDRNPENKKIRDNLGNYPSTGANSLIGGVSNPDPEDKVSIGYKEAKQKILDEMARAEADAFPHESLFCPFGKKKEDLTWAIRRFRKDVNDPNWYLEPYMLRNNEITTPKQFKEMLKSICEFQKFAGCETEVVNLSFSHKAWGATYVNQRVDQILEAIKYLRDQKPPKELELDGFAKEALDKCEDAKKAKRAWDELEDLRKKATQARIDHEAEAKTNILDKKDEIKNNLNKRVTDLKAEITLQQDPADATKTVLEIKNDSVLGKKFTDLQAAAAAGGHGGVGLGIPTSAVEALAAIAKDILNSHPGDASAELDNKLQAEVKKITDLHKEFQSTHQLIDQELKNIQVIFANDPHDPALSKLENNLRELEQAERLLHEELQLRCDSWEKIDNAAIENYVPNNHADLTYREKRDAADLLIDGKNPPGGENVLAKFQAKIAQIGNQLAPMQPVIDAHKNGIDDLVTNIKNNAAAEEISYSNLGKK